MSSSGKSPPRTRAEVEKRIDELTEADLVKLAELAEKYSWALSRAAKGPWDLVQEGILRTLRGKRKWRVNIEFLHHMDRAMRSIANSWKKANAKAPTLQCETVLCDSEGQTSELYSEAASAENLDLAVVDADTFKVLATELRASLTASNDLISLQLFELFREGYQPADMMTLLELSVKQYEAHVRKLRRRAAKIYEGVKRG